MNQIFPMKYNHLGFFFLLLYDCNSYLFLHIDEVIVFLLTAMQAGKGGELTRNETMIIAGALELTTKTASDAMTPISETFAIDVNAKLDRFYESL